jgi:hypothetical protein
MNDLDAALLDAHARGDVAALVTLYRTAADAALTQDARGFYLTHAHVFALELGHTGTAALRAELIAMGREIPL